MNIKTIFNNGDEVKDKITEFQGIVTGYAIYITGCNQLLIQPPMKDGKFELAMWMDEDRCVLINESKINPAEVRAPENVRPGFGEPAPIK